MDGLRLMAAAHRQASPRDARAAGSAVNRGSGTALADSPEKTEASPVVTQTMDIQAAKGGPRE